MNSVTHVAGPYVGIDKRAVQRCLWCGFKLVDTKGQMSLVGPNGEPPRPCFWETLALVRVTGGNPTSYVAVGKFDDEETKLPDDFCQDLVE